jgi:hypothetical protein
MAVTGHHARLGTQLLAKLYHGYHLRQLNLVRLQGATLCRSGQADFPYIRLFGQLFRQPLNYDVDSGLCGHSVSATQPI